MKISVDTERMAQVGENVNAVEVDGKLVIVIDLSVNLGPSSTGKMLGIGSTGGFAPLPGGSKGNIYVGKKVAG